MIPLFRIAFQGQLGPGTHPELVRSLIARRMKLSPPQVDRMFSGRKVILKNNLPEDEALAFAERLQKLGMMVSTEPMPKVPDSIPVSVAIAQEAEAPLPPSSLPAAAPVSALEVIAQAAANEEIDTPAPEHHLTQAQPEAPATVPLTTATPEPAPKAPPRAHTPFEDSWLTASSFANLARTHLNLDRAEALLRFGQPTINEPAPEMVQDFRPAACLFEDAKDLIPLPQKHAPVQVTTEFCCTHCGTIHRIELSISPLEKVSTDQIRVRQERTSA